MKKLIKTVVITLILACGVNPLYAGAGHDHGHEGHSYAEVTKVSAKQKATKRIEKLVNVGKIDKSWLEASVLNIEKKKFKNSMEWVASFKNKKIEDSTKQIIYIFVNMQGGITGANYSGK